MYLPPDMTSLPRAVTHHPKGWTPKPISPAEVTALVNRFWIVFTSIGGWRVNRIWLIGLAFTIR